MEPTTLKKRQPNLRCSVTNRPTAPGAGAQWPPPLLSLRDDSAAGERMVDGSGFYPSHLVLQRTSDAMYRPRSIKDRTGIEPHTADALRVGLPRSGSRDKGPIGRWAYWWRSTNIIPLDLTTIFQFHLLLFIPLQISA